MHTIKSQIFIFAAIILVGCSSVPVYEELYGPSAPRQRVLTPAEMQQGNYVSFSAKVKPILDQRCVVCHSCNDAPCQLKLSSMEGLDRGAHKKAVYNGARFFSQAPTRLGVDAKTTAEWREKGFFPVLNERKQNEQVNLDSSLLYQVLAQKRRHPLPTQGRLPAEYDVGVDLKREESFIHDQTCPGIEDYTKFKLEHPQWGMPFALPGLSQEEFKTIELWLEQGARAEPKKDLAPALQREVTKWEQFFNNSSNKERLMARYIYEHLFVGHIYFNKVSKSDFFMLVRSRTPPGEAIDIIPTIRPYDDPGGENFFYRLEYYDRTIVDKTHIPYAFNDKRMQRYKELFLDADYVVNELPSYKKEIAANPFKAFAAIPAKNRYQFMLDEAHFFVSGFIKGPVCRGSIALSVIDDHFWVLFTNPERDHISRSSKFLERVSDNLRLPSELENNATLISNWTTYRDVEKKYTKEKIKYLSKYFPSEKRSVDINYIWDGNKKNQNAALTVYRHYDSATVLKGFVGEVPKTGWVMDYPIFERIHYLLVAGFDVYGKVGHQLTTRLYMDYLRIESELQLLAFFPIEEKIKMHKHWYRGSKKTEKILKFVQEMTTLREPDIEYKTNDVKSEFYTKVHKHLGGAQQYIDYINLCSKYKERCKGTGLEKSATRVQSILRQLSGIEGELTGVFPNVTFLRVKIDGSVKNDQVYTILRNVSYLNTTSLDSSEKNRIRSEDTIDIVKGLVGAYPNFFLEIDYDELDEFVKQYALIDSFEKYERLVEKFGIRRTNPNFWKSADWFYEKAKHDNPVYAGLFDLNRYKNR